MNYKVLIWSSQRDLWESYCVKRAKCTDGWYLNGKDLFPTRTWPSSPPCPISSSRGTYHTAWGQKGMLVSREGKGPQSQTTGKAYCHLPQHTFTHESFFPRKMWPSQGSKEEYPSSSSGTLPWIVKWSREGVWNPALRTNPPGTTVVAGQVPVQPKP